MLCKLNKSYIIGKLVYIGIGILYEYNLYSYNINYIIGI